MKVHSLIIPTLVAVFFLHLPSSAFAQSRTAQPTPAAEKSGVKESVQNLFKKKETPEEADRNAADKELKSSLREAKTEVRASRKERKAAEAREDAARARAEALKAARKSNQAEDKAERKDQQADKVRSKSGGSAPPPQKKSLWEKVKGT